ncbi:hypothetical protein [Glycomyces salinus]|uniref:hypothetical protein n=1 Tax=Glycomyces salinus TaxID=980294 RepID=UPI0018EBC5EE|nr:hypothetical protein [Glycomyces salinus]
MTPPLTQPRPAVRSQRRFLAVLAVGLGLVALAAVYLVFQLSRGDSPNAEADFAKATCEDFDLAEIANSSAISVESSRAGLWDDLDRGQLNCDYTADSGLALTITVIASADDDGPANSLERAREVSEAGSGTTIEDFDNGDHTGFTKVFSRESVQSLSLFSAAGRLSVTVALDAKPAAFEPSEAVGLVEALAAQARDRFEAYV